MDNLRRFTPPWTVQEGDDHCFRVFDATGFFICAVSHREDLHSRNYQYADAHMRRKEAKGGEADCESNLAAAGAIEAASLLGTRERDAKVAPDQDSEGRGAERIQFVPFE
jgi:hypothetical protein